MGKWLLVVLAVLMVSFTGLAYGQTGDQPYQGDPAGQVVGPVEAGQEGQPPEAAPSQPDATQQQGGVDTMPYSDTREGMQEAAKQVLSGKGTITVDRLNAREGHFKEVYIGGRKIRLEVGRPHKRLSTAAARKANEARVLALIGSRAVKAHWVGKGYVDARDDAVLAASNQYTDQRVDDLSGKTDERIRALSSRIGSVGWTVLLFALFALIFAFAAMLFAYKAYREAKGHYHDYPSREEPRPPAQDEPAPLAPEAATPEPEAEPDGGPSAEERVRRILGQ